MFAERADGVWTNPVALSGNFRSNSTAVDTTVESSRRRRSPQPVEKNAWPRAGFSVALWTKSLENCCSERPVRTVA
jgi:hypothetical protein